MKKIIHVDMDQFFAAVELLDHPELKGLPIAVGHDAERGVVSTASYEARRFGVHSAQSIQVAKRLCPQLIIIEPHFHRYKEVSAQLHDIFHDYTDLIEPISLDEAFLDVTDNKRGIELGVDIARGIDNRPVISEWERKSVSCERTFEKDNNQNADVTIHLYHTVLELVRRIEKNDFEGRTLTLKVKFEDFQQITRSITVDHILRTKDDILPLAKQLMHSVEYHSHPIRLIGLGVSNQKGTTYQAQPRWIQLELEFKD